jgi:uncharacterized protein YjgD (DUF1641 family)
MPLPSARQQHSDRWQRFSRYIPTLSTAAIFLVCLLIAHAASPKPRVAVLPSEITFRGETGAALLTFPASQADAYVVGKNRFNQHDLIRIGRFESLPGQTGFRLLAFHDLDFSLDPYRSAYQLSSTLDTLWKLLVQRDKQRIQQTIQDLLIHTHDILRDIANSQLFRDKYEPQFRQLIIEAAQRTLKRPQVAQAQEVAMDHLLQALSDRILPLLPRIVPKVSIEIISNTLPNLTQRLAFFLRTGRIDPEVLGQALAKALSDPEVQRAIEAALADFMQSEAGATFVKETLAAFATELSADPRLPPLLEAIASDPAILTHFQPLGEEVAQAVRDIATTAFTTDGGQRLEPFAAMVFKAFIFKRQNAFILLTTDALFERLSPLNFPAFKRVENPGAAS